MLYFWGLISLLFERHKNTVIGILIAVIVVGAVLISIYEGRIAALNERISGQESGCESALGLCEVRCEIDVQLAKLECERSKAIAAECAGRVSSTPTTESIPDDRVADGLKEQLNWACRWTKATLHQVRREVDLLIPASRNQAEQIGRISALIRGAIASADREVFLY